MLMEQLSPKRYQLGPRSQEVGEEGGYAYCYTVTAGIAPALTRAAGQAILILHSI